MDKEILINSLNLFKTGELSAEDIIALFKSEPYQDIGFAKIDHHRNLRWGYPEVIFCPGKRNEDIIQIIKQLSLKNNNILATRATKETYAAIKAFFPDATYQERARCITINYKPIKKSKSVILVISAGTADIPVAEEAVISAEYMGNTVERLYDVGVAGLHRLLDNQKTILNASVIIVVAGMEGALASVTGGLVDTPVIAVPTSIGYGASFGGLAALLSMLNSCAAGIGVVNIDNGFGAAALANSIIKLKEVP